MVDKNFLNDIEEQKAIDKIVERGLVGRKSSGRLKKQLMAVAAAVLIGIPAFGAAFPALAQHIPFIGGIFEREDIHEWDRLTEFQEFASEVGVSVEDDGITITIDEVFFDGNIYVSFVIEADRDLGEWVSLYGEGEYGEIEMGLIFDGVPQDIRFGHGHANRVEGNTYAGVTMAFFQDFPIDIELIELLFSISEIYSEIYPDFWCDDCDEAADPVASGNWGFRFPVELINHEIIEVNQTVYSGDFEVSVQRLIILPTTTRFYYASLSLPAPMAVERTDEGYVPVTDWYSEELNWSYISDWFSCIDWEVRDNLGNVYEIYDCGGPVCASVTDEYEDTESFLGLRGIDPEASSLILTPIGRTYKSGDYLGLYDEVELEPIIIDLP